MNFTKTKLLTGLMASGLALGLAGNASASHAYAVSYNDIDNFGITDTGNVTFNILTGDFTSETTSELNGNVNGTSSDLDAAWNCQGPSCPGGGQANNNSFTTIGEGHTLNYGMGDAVIADQNVLGGTGNATNIGEANSWNGNESGGSGTNILSTSFSVSGAGTQLTFSFDAAPYMAALIEEIGDNASATLTMNISIQQLIGGQGETVFEWNPDGQGGGGSGIFGGTESADPFSLNRSITATGLVPANEYDPTGYNPIALGESGLDFLAAGVTYGSFGATTSLLGAGQYVLTVNMNEEVLVSSTVEVPLPAPLLLLGTGLIALGLVRRKAA
jgi:hypothetical protein